jgi:hypothetical protein
VDLDGSALSLPDIELRAALIRSHQLVVMRLAKYRWAEFRVPGWLTAAKELAILDGPFPSRLRLHPPHDIATTQHRLSGSLSNALRPTALSRSPHTFSYCASSPR